MNHYHFDQLGSTRLLTNSAGAVTDEYSYDAYGAVLSYNRSTGSVDQPYQYVGQYGYYAHYMEPGVVLLQLGVRFYDAEVARFTSTDSYDGCLSAYCYGVGTPIASIDPDGCRARRPIKKKPPRHMPQPRKPGKPKVPKPTVPKPKPQPGLGDRLKKIGGKLLRVKACWDWTCRSAIAHDLYVECGDPGEWTRECVDGALDNLDTGLEIIGREGQIDAALAWVGKRCVSQIRREMGMFDWLKDRFKQLL